MHHLQQVVCGEDSNILGDMSQQSTKECAAARLFELGLFSSYREY